MLIVGTSLGEVYKFNVTSSNSVIFENKMDFDTNHPITCLSADSKTMTAVAGTSLDNAILLNIGNRTEEISIIH